MKLKALKLSEFLAYPSLELALSNRVLITGANHVGKTAVRDAIAFALTGIARRLPRKNQATALGRNGGKPRVSLEIDTEVEEGLGDTDVTITRTPTTCSVPASALAVMGLDETLVQVLTDPLYFIDALSAKERQALVMNTLAAAKPDLATEAAKHGIQISGQVAALLKQAGRDPEAAYKAAYEERRAAGQALRAAEEQQQAQVPTTVTISTGKTLDITGDAYTKEAIRTKLEVVEQQYRELMGQIDGGQLIPAPSVRARVEEIDKLLAEKGVGPATEANKQNQAEHRAALLKKKNSMVFTRDRAVADTLPAKGQLDYLRKEMQNTAGAVCSVCGAAVTCPNQAAHDAALKEKRERFDALHKSLALAEKQRQELTRDIEAIDRAVAACDAELAKLAGAANDVPALVKEKRELEAELVTAEAFARYECGPDGGVLPDEERTSRKLKRRVDDGHALLAARRLWDDSRGGVEKAKDAVARHEAAHAAWEKVVAFLAPEGPARAILAGAAATAVFPEELQEAWGCRFQVTPEGDVLFNGRPVELASASERLEAGIMVQAWIAGATLGWVVCDEVDRLVGRDKAGFNRWFAADPEGGLQIIAIASTDKVPERVPSWLTHIRVGGEVVTA